MNEIMIWNDLPLWDKYSGVRESDFIKTFDKCKVNRCKCTFIKFKEVIQWADSFAGHMGLLIGTRPGLMFSGVNIFTRRIKDMTGKTVQVEIDEDNKRRIIKYISSDADDRIVIFEDAIVEGTTTDFIVGMIRNHTQKKIVIHSFFASVDKVSYIVQKYENVSVDSKVLLQGIPIKDFTILFLSDLISRDPLANVPFINNSKLMIPCFKSTYLSILEDFYRIFGAHNNLVLLDMENDKAGYFYLLKTLLNGLQMLDDDERPYVHFGKSDWYPLNRNEDLFEVIFNQVNAYSFPKRVIYGNECDHDSEYCDYDQDSIHNHLMAEVYKKYVSLNPATAKKFQTDYNNLMHGKKVLGAHVRHGFSFDFHGHPRGIPIDLYVETILECMKAGAYEYCFVATDNDVLLTSLKQILGNRILYYQAKRASDLSQPIEFFLSSEQYGGKDSLYEAVRDMITLSMCDEIVIGRSNLSYIALINKLSRNEKFKKIHLLDNGICEGGVSWREYISNGWNKKSRDCLYVTDLDGTLISGDRISQEEKFEWSALLSSKITITIATARSKNGMLRCLDGIIPGLPTIHYNGALIYDHRLKKVIYTCEFEEKDLFTLLDRLLQRENRIMCIYMDKGEDHACFVTDRYPSHCIAVYEYTQMGSLSGNFNTYDCAHFNEYTPEASSKGTAAIWLKNFLGFKMMFAVGDNSNDISMYQCADQYFSYDRYGKEDLKPMEILNRWWNEQNESM